MFNYQAGCFAVTGWAPSGGVLGVLNLKSNNLDLEVMLFDTTTTGSGGLRSRLAGPLDISGTLNTEFDLDAPPYGNPPAILPGVSGICLFGVSPVKAIQLPVIIGKVHYEWAVESEIKWSFDTKANGRAGVLVYPPIP